MTLLEKTVMLLRESNQTTQTIADATGLTYWWIVRLRNGDIKEPSVNKICTLYAYLTGKPLEF